MIFMFCGAGALARDRAPLPYVSEDCHPERSEGTLFPPQFFTAVISSEGALFCAAGYPSERSEGTLSPPQSFTAVISSDGALRARVEKPCVHLREFQKLVKPPLSPNSR